MTKPPGRSRPGRKHPVAGRDRAPRGRRSEAHEPAAALNPERLQKIMAAAGLGSRRALEDSIRQGSITVNDSPAELGQSVSQGERIRFGDQEWVVVPDTERHRTLIYNKKEGEVTTRSDPEGRPTVFDHLPRLRSARWVAIGRLDINTTGLLLLTTDGELANAMMHPSNQVDREYVCRIRGQVSDEQVARLKEGVMLDDGPARFSDIERAGSSGSNQWFKVTLLEGRNREVRRLWQSQNLTVSRLKRVRYGAAVLPKHLKVGQMAPVTSADYRVLREDVGLAPAVQELTLRPVRGRGVPGKRVTRKEALRRGTAGGGTAGKRSSARGKPARTSTDWPAPSPRSQGPGKVPGAAAPVRRPAADSAAPSAGGPGRRPDAWSEARSEARPGRGSGARSGTRSAGRSDTRPGTRSDDRPGRRSDDRPGKRAATNAGAQTDARPAGRAESLPGARPAGRAGPRPGARSDERPGKRSAARSDSRRGTRSDAPPAKRSEASPARQSGDRADSRADARPLKRSQSRADSRSGPRPDPRPGGRPDAGPTRRPGAKPGSPAGAGRRPQPRSPKSRGK